MCHQSMKFSDTFDQNPPCAFDKIKEKTIIIKMLLQFDLESKGQAHSKKQKIMPLERKNMPPPKNLSRGSLSNWCDTNPMRMRAPTPIKQ